MAEVEVITIDQVQEFERMLLEHPETQKAVQNILKTVLRKARSRVSKDARNAMGEDPRAAYRAVKHTVYKRILGGNISILAKRRASNTRVRIQRDGTLRSGQVGGNRRKRSARTEQVDSYFASDRGFILRFINNGTANRNTRYGNRGRISGRPWFDVSATHQLNAAADEFVELMEKEYTKILK